jgi:hypothetical protein
LAIRGWLKPRELPLWSLKPPYCPEKTLVSPLSEIPTLGKSLEKKMGEVLSAQGKEMSEIKSNIVALSTQMAAIMALEILVSPPFEDYAQGWSQI